MGGWLRRAPLLERRRDWRCLALVGAAVALALCSAAPRAQTLAHLTHGEVKFGVLAHDAGFLGGKEHGVDLNPELIMPSPVTDAWAASLPGYLRWMV